MEGYALSEDELFSSCLHNFTWENAHDQQKAWKTVGPRGARAGRCETEPAPGTSRRNPSLRWREENCTEPCVPLLKVFGTYAVLQVKGRHHTAAEPQSAFSPCYA
ncbi:hypothetical protein COCON_G00115470 [Conger conger]|uniref:Uncharacterized protein n=1 Tax=Conger conger TaxID=82655 RepID=A0A9Q1DGM3_CONCO|nr:hypothetical protein COCON_G00115470 [Conger conger]